MPNSRSKYSEDAVNRRRSLIRDVLLGVLIGLAVIIVVMAGRFIYNKSKDPNYRIADLFGFSDHPSGTLPTMPMPSFPSDLIIPSSSESLPETSDPSSVTADEETTPEETTEPETSSEEPVTESGEEPVTQEPDTKEPGTEGETQPSSSETAADPTQPSETTPEETPEETTEESTAPVVVDPTDINYHLVRGSMSEEDLGNCRQLVVVQSSGTQCTLYFFDKTDDGWTLSDAVPSAPGVLGRGGVTKEKKEGDGCTPAGYFALGPCYGEDVSSPTAMEYHQIVDGDCWVDDPASVFYNQMVHAGTDGERRDWRSSEDMYKLLRYYHYMCVIRYNMDPIVPGAGSAIFLHCQAGDSDTSGCVSTKDATVFAILRWLTPDADPHILIY